MRVKKWIALGLTVVLATGTAALLGGCGNSSGSAEKDTAAESKKSVIRVGSKDFTEGLLVGEIYALALEDHGFEVERKLNIAGSLVHTSIVNDEIDVYPEYTGTGLMTVLGMDMMSDPDEVYQTVKEEYEKQFSLTWLDSSQVNDTSGIAIRKETADEYGIYTVSDLQKNADKIRLCSQGEFEEREDGLPGLEKAYGPFNFKSIKQYDSGLKYEILRNDEADICPGYSTDAALCDTDSFVYLEDDKNFWPPFYLAPVVRDDTLAENPEIAEALNEVSAHLDTETMIKLNAKVDLDKEEYEEVAKEFYDSISK